MTAHDAVTWWNLGQAAHAYVPDDSGTRCSAFGCWGWVDDPRHTRRLTRAGLAGAPPPEQTRRVSSRPSGLVRR